ncbi:MAG TPA: hypothetical protein ENK65_02060 [Helicobacteraceae bacterium]|nr:hypothetical protein [Helicobacteraceae bacterium]
MSVVNADGGAMQENETKSYDYAPTHKTITFTKNSKTQTIAKPIYDGSYKESDEAFWLSPVGGYGESKVANIQVISIQTHLNNMVLLSQ